MSNIETVFKKLIDYLKEKTKISSLNFKKSLISFETMKNKELVKKILGGVINNHNENIMYASLIMSPEMCTTIGEDNIKNMSLKRIHMINKNLTIKKIKKIPLYILTDETITIDRIDNFLIILGKLQENEKLELVDILNNTFGTDKAGLEDNLLFAKQLLSPEIYKIIGEENLENENMSPEKIHSIKDNLTIKQIKALGGANLANKNMTIDKIELIGQMFTPDEIFIFRPIKLASISIKDLQKKLYSKK